MNVTVIKNGTGLYDVNGVKLVQDRIETTDSDTFVRARTGSFILESTWTDFSLRISILIIIRKSFSIMMQCLL